MFDHVGLKVANLATSMDFYRRTLAALGHELGSSGEGYAGFGPQGAPALWLYEHPGRSVPAPIWPFALPIARRCSAFTPRG